MEKKHRRGGAQSPKKYWTLLGSIRVINIPCSISHRVAVLASFAPQRPRRSSNGADSPMPAARPGPRPRRIPAPARDSPLWIVLPPEDGAQPRRIQTQGISHVSALTRPFVCYGSACLVSPFGKPVQAIAISPGPRQGSLLGGKGVRSRRSPRNSSFNSRVCPHSLTHTERYPSASLLKSIVVEMHCC